MFVHSGVSNLIWLVGKVSADTAQDIRASSVMPAESYVIGMSLHTASGAVSDSAVLSLRMHQTRGLTDSGPHLERLYRGRGLAVPMGDGRYVVAMLFGEMSIEGRAPALPWLTAGPDGIVRPDDWPLIGIWDGSLLSEVDPSRLPGELKTLRVTSRRTGEAASSDVLLPLPFSGREYMKIRKIDGETYLPGIHVSQYKRAGF